MAAQSVEDQTRSDDEQKTENRCEAIREHDLFPSLSL